MKVKHVQFVGTVPENYDTYLGPLIFEFSAKDLAERVNKKVSTDASILETACGTGISTEFLRSFLPESTTIVATDLNDAMLSVARSKRGNLKGVTYQVADAIDLPFKNEQFDAVVCQFGIMFYPDKLKGLQEMVRVLKPNGFIVFNVWDSFAENKAFGIMQEKIATFFEKDPPTFLETPFGFNDIDYITDLMKQAGIENIEHDTVTSTTNKFSTTHIAKGGVIGNPTIGEINERATADDTTIIKEVAAALEKEYGSKFPRVSFKEIVFSGEKPA